MKKFINLSVILACTLMAQGQKAWYQKEKPFHPFIAGAAAIGGKDAFTSFKSWEGKDVWNAVEAGVMNKNTSFGLSATSYEWNKLKDIYFGAVIQRRIFYIGRFEQWASVAYGLPLAGQRDYNKFQWAFRERLQLEKSIAIEVSYQENLNAGNHNLDFHKGPAFSFAIIISKNGNVNSNNKY